MATRISKLRTCSDIISGGSWKMPATILGIINVIAEVRKSKINIHWINLERRGITAGKIIGAYICAAPVLETVNIIAVFCDAIWLLHVRKENSRIDRKSTRL